MVGNSSTQHMLKMSATQTQVQRKRWPVPYHKIDDYKLLRKKRFSRPEALKILGIKP